MFFFSCQKAELSLHDFSHKKSAQNSRGGGKLQHVRLTENQPLPVKKKKRAAEQASFYGYLLIKSGKGGGGGREKKKMREVLNATECEFDNKLTHLDKQVIGSMQ